MGRMQDPQAIVEAVREGRAPAAWKVLRPRSSFGRNSVLLGGCLGLFAAFFLSVVGFIGLVAISSGASLGSSTVNDQAAIAATSALLLSAIACIVLGIIIGARRANTAKDSYLVITPEGVVRALSKKRIEAIDFAALDDITTLMVIQSNNNSTSTSTSLELHYRNGRTRTWHPGMRFGSDQSLVQRIITAFQEYAATAEARSRGIQ
jgi:hypothetical protein